jgi:hypothetical protein
MAAGIPDIIPNRATNDRRNTNMTATIRRTVSANDSSTPEQLLELAVQRTTDSSAALIALQRWESDGGTVHPARRWVP